MTHLLSNNSSRLTLHEYMYVNNEWIAIESLHLMHNHDGLDSSCDSVWYLFSVNSFDTILVMQL